MQIIMRRVSELKNYENNARTHSEEQIEEIYNSIKSFGFNDPIEIGIDDIVISGHARLAAAIKAGFTEVPTIIHAHLKKSARRGYILAANRIAQNAGWDKELLREEFRDLEEDEFNLKLTGFTEEEIEEYLAEDNFESEVDEDGCDAVASKAITKYGDVWILDNHRLMCGDSVNLNDVEKLMQSEKADMVFTDPPYNADYTSRVDEERRKPWGEILNDNMLPEDFDIFLNDIMSTLTTVLNPGASVYCCINWKCYPKLVESYQKYFLHKSTLIWDKKSFGLGTYYRTQYEMILFGCYGDKLNIWNAAHDECDVWAMNRDSVIVYAHPTQKPVELAERAIENSSHQKQIVIDLFGGSGSTLIACAKLKRKCYMMELSPNYCDVIIKRWQKFTNEKAVLETTGQLFDGI